jgi:hypothetical protein
MVVWAVHSGCRTALTGKHDDEANWLRSIQEPLEDEEREVMNEALVKRLVQNCLYAARP